MYKRQPLDQGVISDNELCEKMLQHFLKKVYQNALLKPRVALCVPSAITDVESRAVVDAAVKAGARKVYLIEEPVAAAIGAKIDISKPAGHLVPVSYTHLVFPGPDGFAYSGHGRCADPD